MQFPFYIGIGSWKIHPHFLFESLGYTISLRLLLRNVKSDTIPFSQRSSVIVGGLVGALIGAKGLVLLQHLDLLLGQHWQQWLLLIPQGKTVVGALLGAVVGVELIKSRIGLTKSTGDTFVYPLIAGTAIGRVGCFLTGLSDRTYGIATDLPWGIDFGDGIARHPTQLYEIIFLASLGLMLWSLRTKKYPSGVRFQIYLASYLSFRFGVDFLKPDFHPLWGMSAVQMACLIGLLYCARQLFQLSSIPR
ncbi:MAG: prolipoprotein diacylglyceryl transferase [Thermosynechococcaceae cyanobacterium]